MHSTAAPQIFRTPPGRVPSLSDHVHVRCVWLCIGGQVRVAQWHLVCIVSNVGYNLESQRADKAPFCFSK